MTRVAKAGKAESFEQNLERLDAIVHQLEDAELPLEKALQLYEEGMKLSEVCHEQLQEAEGRVEILLKKPGAPTERTPEPFEAEENPPL
jgi:exodeoxyribonuclease VII small subunit